MTVTAFPLTWPTGFDRTQHREAGRFKTTLASAIQPNARMVKLVDTRDLKSLGNNI